MWRSDLKVCLYSLQMSDALGPASTALFLAVSLSMVLESLYSDVHRLNSKKRKCSSISYFLNGLIRVNLN